MKKIKITLLAISLFFISKNMNAQQSSIQQSLVDKMSEQLELKYQIVDNHAAVNGINCSVLGADWGACSKIILSLKNIGETIDDKDWAIYFHSIRMVLAVQNDQFKITQLTGDLHKLEPTEKFVSFPAGKIIEIPVIYEYWQVSQSDVMPKWYVVSGDAQPKIIKNTDTEETSTFIKPISKENWKRTPEDKNILITPVTRFEKNKQVTKLDSKFLRGKILPTPKKMLLGNEDINIGEKGVNLVITYLDKNTQSVLINHFKAQEIPLNPNGFKIQTIIDKKYFPKGINGAYNLEISNDQAKITAFDASGAFYGVESVLSLIPAGKVKTIPVLKVEDVPRFQYRGVMLDIGRNFKSKEAILRLLDQMSRYKMNKFHLHLTDDEGWRIEISGLSELTEIGSKRCHDLEEQNCILPQLGSGPNSDNKGSGYLTKSDYIEIIKYAKDRHIEVIPEIDMPAHARAAVVSMEARFKRLLAEGKGKKAEEFRLIDPTDNSNTTSVQFYNRQSYLNPCLSSARNFVNKVITEVADMHKEAGQPLKTWHFGGDEAKNIRLGAGYQDKNSKEKVNFKGTIDQSIEDHPWAKSQICQKFIEQGDVKDIEHLPGYFAQEVSKIIKDHGINRMQAWQDGLKHLENAKSFATDSVAVNFWDTIYWGGFDTANEWAGKGYQVIISNPDYVYLDMPYEVTPLERGYYWAARFNDEQKIFSFAPDNLPQNAETSVDRDGNIFSAKGTSDWAGAYGLSAQLWSESVRTDKEMEYMIYPRMLAVAERAWHKADWEKDYKKNVEFKKGETHYVDQKALSNDWIHFANIVGQRELPKLDKAGIEYRLPVPGAVIENNKLIANIIYPGLIIEYSNDNGKNWYQYEVPVNIADNNKILVRSRNLNEKRVSRVEEVD